MEDEEEEEGVIPSAAFTRSAYLLISALFQLRFWGWVSLLFSLVAGVFCL